MALTDDSLARIRRDLSRGAAISTIDRLAELRIEDREHFSDRILRCMVFVATGRPRVVEKAIPLARLDFRDLIVWAEYDGDFETRQRDLLLPIGGWQADRNTKRQIRYC